MRDTCAGDVGKLTSNLQQTGTYRGKKVDEMSAALSALAGFHGTAANSDRRVEDWASSRIGGARVGDPPPAMRKEVPWDHASVVGVGGTTGLRVPPVEDETQIPHFSSQESQANGGLLSSVPHGVRLVPLGPGRQPAGRGGARRHRVALRPRRRCPS